MAFIMSGMANGVLSRRGVAQVFIHSIRRNSNRTSLAKIGREKYLLMYPTVVVNSDGSTYTIRYHEPRKIINLPLDLSKLTEELLQAYWFKKKPKDKVKLEEDPEDDFDVGLYSHLWKKNETPK